MNTIRFYKAAIIILILLNLGTLTFLWISRPRPGQAAHRGRSEEFLIRELALTPKQQDEFGKLRDMHSEKLRMLQEQDRKLHDRFFDALFLPATDTLALDIISDSISDIRKQMELLTFEHFSQLRQVLTERQKVRFHQVFRQALERVMPMPLPPAPPPPPPPPPR